MWTPSLIFKKKYQNSQQLVKSCQHLTADNIFYWDIYRNGSSPCLGFFWALISLEPLNKWSIWTFGVLSLSIYVFHHNKLKLCWSQAKYAHLIPSKQGKHNSRTNVIDFNEPRLNAHRISMKYSVKNRIPDYLKLYFYVRLYDAETVTCLALWW